MYTFVSALLPWSASGPAVRRRIFALAFCFDGPDIQATAMLSVVNAHHTRPWARSSTPASACSWVSEVSSAACTSMSESESPSVAALAWRGEMAVTMAWASAARVMGSPAPDTLHAMAWAAKQPAPKIAACVGVEVSYSYTERRRGGYENKERVRDGKGGQHTSPTRPGSLSSSPPLDTPAAVEVTPSRPSTHTTAPTVS